jgi:glycosyltransferase involved in cell wall biosynthesis
VPTGELKAIAFYLPQFHPFPENDEWWGAGFTEWTNVSKSVPQFVGHYQPRLPGELGFYDLRLKPIQRRQMELARLYGIHGFCYHHYWFAGKRLMETPVNNILTDKTLDLPFCLCWANENWTRRWDGAEHDILIAQMHSPEDDLAFIEDIAPALADPRYIRVNGRPLLIVYRVSLLPDPVGTAKRWRDYCREQGIGELYLVAAQTFGIRDPRQYGFDAAVEFPPHTSQATNITEAQQFINPYFSGMVYEYSDLLRQEQAFQAPDYTVFKCAFPAWDNSARKPGKGHVFHNATPALFEDWLRLNARYTLENHPQGEQLMFVNAWNEWAEGAHLEPDRRYGYANLEAVGRVLTDCLPDRKKARVSVVVPAYNHEHYIVEALDSIRLQSYRDIEIVVVDDGSTDGTAEAVRRYAQTYPELNLQLVVKQNGGSHTAIEAGVSKAQGEFIAILNSDDQFAVDRIELLMEAMRRDSADLAFSDVAFIDEKGASLNPASLDYVAAIREKVDGAITFPSLLYACLDSNIAVSTGNFLFKRSLYDRLGGFASLKLCHDWDFLLRAQIVSRVSFVNAALYSYRVHGHNTFSDVQDLAVEETGKVITRFFSFLSVEAGRRLFPERRYFVDFMMAHGFDKYVPTIGANDFHGAADQQARVG